MLPFWQSYNQSYLHHLWMSWTIRYNLKTIGLYKRWWMHYSHIQLLKQLRRDRMILRLKLPLCHREGTRMTETCLVQLYDFTGNGFSGWPSPEKLFLAPPPLSLNYSCSQHSCVDLNGSLVSSTALSYVVSAPSFSVSLLQITATGMFLDVALRQHVNGEGQM